MRKPIIAGNWKMFKTAAESQAFATMIKDQVTDQVEAVICAPFTSLSKLTESLAGSDIGVGAQNMHHEDNGAYTGEISGGMLAALGVGYVIIGHSERREKFYETDESVNQKVLAAFRYGLTPIVCIGESLVEREANQTVAVVRSQTKAALAGVSAEQIAQVVLAYEPIWAIGTGKSSSAADANEVIAEIRKTIAADFGQAAADQVRIQYGGSVKPTNIKEYMAQPEIDGALVGGASLEAESYLGLLQGASAQ